MNILKMPKTNLVFLVLLASTLIYALFALGLGAQQDRRFNQDYSLFQTAGSMLDQGNPRGAEPTIRQLLDQQPTSYILLWDYGISLAGLGDFARADYFFARTEAQRPFVVNNPTFLIQYGQVLFTEGKYAEAKKYLLRLNQVTNDPKFLQLAQPMLAEIKTKLQGK